MRTRTIRSGATALRLLARDAQGVRAALNDVALSGCCGISRDAAAGSLALLLLPIVLPSLPPSADDSRCSAPRSNGWPAGFS